MLNVMLRQQTKEVQRRIDVLSMHFSKDLMKCCYINSRVIFRKHQTLNGTSIRQSSPFEHGFQMQIIPQNHSKTMENVKFFIIMLFYYQFLKQMEKQKQKANKPKRYAKIPIELRMKLVQLVLKKLFPVSMASRKLSIKLSTAKLIIKKYKEDGTFFEKREDRLARLSAQEPGQDFQNPSENIVEVGPEVGIYNDPQLNTTLYWINYNNSLGNSNDYLPFNNFIHWSYLGIFFQNNSQMSRNYSYFC